MIKWDEKYSVGIPLIDVQHQKLFALAMEITNKLDNFKENNENHFIEIMDIMNQLLDYTKYHFSQEEKLMSHYGYPQLELHEKEHQGFIEYLNKVDYIRVNDRPKQTILELTKFIINWILKHILDKDFMFKDFIAEAMAKEVSAKK